MQILLHLGFVHANVVNKLFSITVREGTVFILLKIT